MSLGTLSVNIFVGILFVVVWGVLSYVAASEAEFKSFFFGGLANFLFFIGGVLASYFSSFVSTTKLTINETAVVPRAPHRDFSVLGALYVATVTMCTIVLLNLFAEGFTNSLDRLEHLGTISFQQDGYRDIQIYANGTFGILCFLAAWTFGLYLGSVRSVTTYLTVLSGVLISIGVQGLLYILYGIFFTSNVFQILNVSTPPVLDTYGPTLKRLFGLAITFTTVIFVTLTWTTLFWLSVKLGGLTLAIQGRSRQH